MLVNNKGKLVIKIMVKSLMWFGKVKVRFKFKLVIFKINIKIIRVIVVNFNILGNFVFKNVFVLMIIVDWSKFRVMIKVVEVKIIEKWDVNGVINRWLRKLNFWLNIIGKFVLRVLVKVVKIIILVLRNCL